MVQANFNIKKKTFVYSYTFATHWWAYRQLKYTSKVSFVVEEVYFNGA